VSAVEKKRVQTVFSSLSPSRRRSGALVEDHLESENLTKMEKRTKKKKKACREAKIDS